MSKENQKIKEDELVEQAFNRLKKDYLNSAHSKNCEKIEKAFRFAKSAHEGIKRKSGEPYIMHPIAVAHIACKDIGLGSTSICAALLHDVVEDTEYTTEDIRNLFGDKIAEIVDGLTKLAGGVFGDQASGQAENFRRLIITMAEDIRVVLIKIADRLHNMRTLDAQSTSKQYKIAGETEYIYAPLAHRLGLFAIKSELENLSFKYNYPESYNVIQNKLDEDKHDRMKMYDQFSLPIMNRLNDKAFDFTMKSRVKSAFSIWKKMQAKYIPMDEVYDILGARIIFQPMPGTDERVECWKIYNTITQIYKPHPERTRDWLSNPKATGYEALHVTVMGPKGQWIEVQIRSKRMDDIAEKGLAAHWTYKHDYTNSETKIEEWLSVVNDLLKNPDSDAMQFLDSFKLTLYHTEILVFTPKGQMLTMPKGATALDFAFEIHSDIGLHCIGAKINNKLEPISYVLQSGDQVEVLTAKQQTPQEDWINYATTIRAKESLHELLKKSDKLFRNKGHIVLVDALTALGFSIKKEIPTEIIRTLLEHYNFKSYDDLLIDIGKDKILLNGLSSIVQNNKSIIDLKTPKLKRKTKKESVNNADLNNEKYKIAACCKPVPGDDILGFKKPDGTVYIHKKDCQEATRLKSQIGSDIVPVEWTQKQQQVYTAIINIQGIDRSNMLLDIATIISRQPDGDIKKIILNTLDGIFNAKLTILTSHVNDINNLCNELLKIDGIEKVVRLKEEGFA